MKKFTWLYGTILGVILCANMLYTVNLCYTNPDFESNDVLGYAAMVVVFSLVFFGVRTYRNKQVTGAFTFGRAFKMGALIAFVGASIYVLAWLFYYYLFVPDFLDKYIPHVMLEATRNGATTTELAAKSEEMAQFKEMYKQPVFVVLITYMEVFPVGLVVAAFSGLVLRRKGNKAETAVTEA